VRTNCTLDSVVKHRNTTTQVIKIGLSANFCRMLIHQRFNLWQEIQAVL